MKDPMNEELDSNNWPSGTHLAIVDGGLRLCCVACDYSVPIPLDGGWAVDTSTLLGIGRQTFGRGRHRC